jgi:excisionase family DNA binding protein
MATATSESYTLAEAAARLNRSERTVREWISAGRLPARKVMGRVVIPADAVARLLTGTPIPVKVGA